jgi:purine nucleosidase
MTRRMAIGVILILMAAAGPAAAGRLPVIIDTDVAMGYPGHDVDDGLVLMLALNSPELEILGITTAWGNYTQAKTFAKAQELLAAAGRTEIPCLRGADGRRDLGRETPASRFIADTVRARPGEVSIVMIGTATNVATAIKLNPGLVPAIVQVVSMGGTVAPPGHWPLGAMTDLNYGADVPSARTVLMSGVRFTMINSRLCYQTMLTPERYRRLTAEAPFMRELLAAQTRDWYRLMRVAGPVIKMNGFVPWDVQALAYLMHPEWFSDNWVKGEIDPGGWGYKTVVLRDQHLDPASADFNAPDRIDAAPFWEWFFDRI